MIERSPVFDDYCSFEALVEIVTAGTALFSSEYLAGQYAFEAAREAGYGVGDNELAAHMDFLAEAGAKFESIEAFAVAREFAAQLLTATNHE